jgi:IS1 family transposase
VIKNGSIHSGKPKWKCKACGRQFVAAPNQRRISDATKQTIDKLRLERVSLAGIVRVIGVSARWFQYYVNATYTAVIRSFAVNEPKKGALILDFDESWSFVGKKRRQQWVWLAINRETREIVGMVIGSRTRSMARKLWKSLPAVYRQCAVCYTDFWVEYDRVLPSKRHRQVGKDSGQTNHIERFNNTMRQRCSRLVRKTLSFSKKLANHIGALWYFIHDYNACQRAKRFPTTLA